MPPPPLLPFYAFRDLSPYSLHLKKNDLQSHEHPVHRPVSLEEFSVRSLWCGVFLRMRLLLFPCLPQIASSL